jgi:S-adenosyl-L-methionine hydrolase (adenosine-forming)
MISVIALLTDFGWQSWYVGVMKGVIAGINQRANVIDLSHDVSSQDVSEGSFILGSAFRYFPPGTIFVAVVDPGVGGKRRNLLVKTERHLFVAPDNGVLSLALDRSKVETIREIVPGKYTLPLTGSTFLGRDVFAPVAAHLSRGVAPDKMGNKAESVVRVSALEPVVTAAGEIFGRAVHVDSFGNIITNIDESALLRVFPGELPRRDLAVRLAGRTIRGVARRYEEAAEGELAAIVNSWGLVEIAVNRGNAFRAVGAADKKSLEILISRAL